MFVKVDKDRWADFQAFVSALGTPLGVFYHATAADMHVFAIQQEGHVLVRTRGTLATLTPAVITAVYPSAVALAQLPEIYTGDTAAADL